MKPKLLCILGETCSGKDSIINGALSKLSNYDIRKVCSYTDRPMRDGETDGVEHYFVTSEEFNKLKKERERDIIAYTHIKDKKQKKYQGYQYMAFSDELEKSHIYIIDYEGLKYLRKEYNDKIDIVIIYIHASLTSRLNRAKESRSDFNTEFKKRVKAEEKQFNVLRKFHYYDYKILNVDNHLDQSIGRLCNIINYELLHTLPYLKKTNS